MKLLRQIVQRGFRSIGYSVVANATLRELQAKASSQVPSLIDDYAALLRSQLLPNMPPIDRHAASLLARLEGITVSQGLLLLDHMSLTAAVAGDVCEFGCASGATSALLGEFLRGSNKKLWIFDSFQGLSAPGVKDELKNDIFGLGSMDRYEGKMAHPERSVRRRLSEINFPVDRLQIIPGFIDDTIRREPTPSRVAFAFVDFDLYSPILTALEFLDGVIADGGIVIVHDYDFFSTGAKTAVDEFAAAHHSRYLLRLPPAPFSGVAVLERRDRAQRSDAA